jgi:hypothetical protein
MTVGGFNNSIADPKIGGTFLILLYSMTQLGNSLIQKTSFNLF